MRAAASLFVLLLVTACGATSTASPNPPSPSPSPVVSASPSAQPTVSPSASPTAATSPSPAASPSACQTQQGGTAARALITDVRVGTHVGYDRVVIEFSGGLPAYKIIPQDPTTFVGPASGQPIPVAGSYGYHLYIYQMDIPPTYAHGNLKPGYSVLQQVVVMAVFEGQADVEIGVATPVCPTVAVYSAPDRLVIDFPTA